MGLRFQRRIKVLPGVRINLSKSGLGFSVGGRGAHTAAQSLHHFRRLRRAVGCGLASHPQTQPEGRFAPLCGIAQADLCAGADQRGCALELLQGQQPQGVAGQREAVDSAVLAEKKKTFRLDPRGGVNGESHLKKVLLVLPVLYFAVATFGRAPARRWVVDLSQVAGGASVPATGRLYPIASIMFSQDGKWLAVVRGYEVWLLPADGATAGIRRIQLPREANSWASHSQIHWSPHGDYIAVRIIGTNYKGERGGVIIRVSDGARCEIPQEVRVIGSFVDARHVIVARMVLPKDAVHHLVNSSPASIYDTGCKLETTW